MNKLMLTAALALFGFGFTGTMAQATDPCCHYKKVVCEEYVTVWVTKSVPYEKEIVKSDHCNKPYIVTVTCYKDVQVPVKKCVTVVKWVKVCD